jgi:glycerol-3-phosphate dehydrogenase
MVEAKKTFNKHPGEGDIMASFEYDLGIVGGGAAGLTAAAEAQYRRLDP